jgi:hypothetical protein
LPIVASGPAPEDRVAVQEIPTVSFAPVARPGATEERTGRDTGQEGQGEELRLLRGILSKLDALTTQGNQFAEAVEGMGDDGSVRIGVDTVGDSDSGRAVDHPVGRRAGDVSIPGYPRYVPPRLPVLTGAPQRMWVYRRGR